jgi:hypothetical protein
MRSMTHDEAESSDAGPCRPFGHSTRKKARLIRAFVQITDASVSRAASVAKSLMCGSGQLTDRDRLARGLIGAAAASRRLFPLAGVDGAVRGGGRRR